MRISTSPQRGGGALVDGVAEVGITYEASARPKAELYCDALPLLNSGKAELLDHRKLRLQLLGLERRVSRGGRDSVDHGRGPHDDVCNAAVGALLLVQADSFVYVNLAVNASLTRVSPWV